MYSVLQAIKFEDEADQDNSLYNVISRKHRKDLTRFFWADMIYRIHSKRINNFFCLFIWGEQGTAKSGVGQLIMQVLFPQFRIEQVCFTNEELRRKMFEIPKGEAILRDEFQKVFGEGTYQLQATIENYTRQLRDRGNSFIYIQPDFMDMKNFHFYLRTIAFDEQRRIVTAGLQNPMTNGYMGYVNFDLNPIWNNGFWRQYQERKNQFTDVVVTNQYEKVDITGIARIIMKDKLFKSCIVSNDKGDKLDMGMVKNIVYKLSPNLTTGQNNMLVHEIKYLYKNGGEEDED
jgi:hypothetical protein